MHRRCADRLAVLSAVPTVAMPGTSRRRPNFLLERKQPNPRAASNRRWRSRHAPGHHRRRALVSRRARYRFRSRHVDAGGAAGGQSVGLFWEYCSRLPFSPESWSPVVRWWRSGHRPAGCSRWRGSRSHCPRPGSRSINSRRPAVWTAGHRRGYHQYRDNNRPSRGWPPARSGISKPVRASRGCSDWGRCDVRKALKKFSSDPPGAGSGRSWK